MAAVALISSACLPLARGQEKAPAEAAVGTDRPTVVLAVNSLDKLVPDLIYLFRAAGQQSYGGLVTLFANQYGQGLDRSRPLGVAVNLPENEQPRVFLMLPIKDIDTFFAANAQFITQDELSENKYSLIIGVSNLYATLQNEWLFVTQFEEDLEAIPQNPRVLLDTLVPRYDLGLTLNVASIPSMLKEQFIANLEQGFESAMARQGEGKSDEELAASRASGEATMEEIKRLIENSEQLLFGLNIDQGSKVVQLDFGSKFVEGSDLAKEVALQEGLTSKFAATTTPADPIQIRFRSKLGENNIQQTTQALDMQLNQLDSVLKTSVDDTKAREIIKSFATMILTSMKSTVAEGDIDGAYAINFENGVHMVALGQVAQPEKLESDLVALLNKHSSEQYAPKLNGSAQDYKGIKLYSGNWPLPPDDDFDGLRASIGEAVPFAMVFGNKQAGLAFGKDAVDNLKAAVDRSAGTPAAANPMDLTVELLPILQYVDSMLDDPKSDFILQAAITKASEFSNNDMFKIESRAMNSGFIMRTTLEEGLLQAIGAAATASAGPRR